MNRAWPNYDDKTVVVAVEYLVNILAGRKNYFGHPLIHGKLGDNRCRIGNISDVDNTKIVGFGCVHCDNPRACLHHPAGGAKRRELYHRMNTSRSSSILLGVFESRHQLFLYRGWRGFIVGKLHVVATFPTRHRL